MCVRARDARRSGKPVLFGQQAASPLTAASIGAKTAPFSHGHDSTLFAARLVSTLPWRYKCSTPLVVSTVGLPEKNEMLVPFSAQAIGCARVVSAETHEMMGLAGALSKFVRTGLLELQLPAQNHGGHLNLML